MSGLAETANHTIDVLQDIIKNGMVTTKKNGHDSAHTAKKEDGKASGSFLVTVTFILALFSFLLLFANTWMLSSASNTENVCTYNHLTAVDWKAELIHQKKNKG